MLLLGLAIATITTLVIWIVWGYLGEPYVVHSDTGSLHCDNEERGTTSTRTA